MLSDKEIICPDNLLNLAHKKRGVAAGIVNAGKPLPMQSVMDAVKENLIIKVGELAIKLRVLLEPVQIGVDGKPLVGAAVPSSEKAIPNSQTDYCPVLDVINGGETAYSQWAGAGAGGQAVDSGKTGVQFVRCNP